MYYNVINCTSILLMHDVKLLFLYKSENLLIVPLRPHFVWVSLHNEHTRDV